MLKFHARYLVGWFRFRRMFWLAWAVVEGVGQLKAEEEVLEVLLFRT